MTKKRLIITSIIVLIVLACGSFYGGMIYGKSQSAASSASAAGSFLGLRGGRGGSTTISGNIISGDSREHYFGIAARRFRYRILFKCN